MFAKSAIISAILLAASLVQAVPTTDNQPNEFGLVITKTVTLPDGAVLTTWSEAPESRRPGVVSSRSTLTRTKTTATTTCLSSLVRRRRLLKATTWT